MPSAPRSARGGRAWAGARCRDSRAGTFDWPSSSAAEPTLEVEESFWGSAPAPSERAPVELRLGRLDIADGRLRLEHRELRVELQAEDVGARASWDDALDGLAGRVSGAVGFGAARRWQRTCPRRSTGSSCGGATRST